mmetsp:Transcript_36164/g.96352  ORF Transcript_36164/g.96352 Transcript_36164/m.96352 type:complete len:208 (+) Transcript_36164:380-1003(+)
MQNQAMPLCHAPESFKVDQWLVAPLDGVAQCELVHDSEHFRACGRSVGGPPGLRVARHFLPLLGLELHSEELLTQSQAVAFLERRLLSRDDARGIRHGAHEDAAVAKPRGGVAEQRLRGSGGLECVVAGHLRRNRVEPHLAQVLQPSCAVHALLIQKADEVVSPTIRMHDADLSKRQASFAQQAVLGPARIGGHGVHSLQQLLEGDR